MTPRPRLRLLVAGLACVAGAPAAAGPIDIPGTTRACAGAEDAIGCLSRLADRSQARVRAGFARARAALGASATIEAGQRPAAIATLDRTQAAWRAYVRARCEGEVPVLFSGGTGRNAAVLTCLRVHGERRAAELADLAAMD